MEAREAVESMEGMVVRQMRVDMGEAMMVAKVVMGVEVVTEVVATEVEVAMGAVMETQEVMETEVATAVVATVVVAMVVG